METRKKYEFSQFLSVLRFTGCCAKKKRRKKGEFVLVLMSMVASYVCTEKKECVCVCVCVCVRLLSKRVPGKKVL